MTSGRTPWPLHQEDVMSSPITEVANPRDTATLLRWAVGALTMVVAASLLAVLAIPAVVVALAVGGVVTFFVRPGRLIAAAAAGLLGLFVVVLAGNYLAAGDLGGAPIADLVFVFGGGALGLITVVLAGATLAGRGNH
jgi:hypothetical protein